MSLTGQLDVFSLEEVLRLLSRSSKSGCLRIVSPALQGYVYFDAGCVALAMVGTEEELRAKFPDSSVAGVEEHLRVAGMDDSGLERAAPENLPNHEVNDFFQDEVVENLYRIRQQEGGEFVFNADVVPRYRSSTSFDVELCVSGMDLRAAEWADIESAIPSIDTALRVSPETPNGEPVTLDPSTWRLVAGFEGEATVRTLGDRLGVSRFRVAKDLTTLVRNGLVEVATEAGLFASPQQPTLPTEAGDHAPTAPEPMVETPDSYNQGWWTEPVEPATVSPTPEPAIDPGDAAGSSDPFLDRVFAQLEEAPEGQGSPDGTVAGFLKRRRMSSIGLDE